MVKKSIHIVIFTGGFFTKPEKTIHFWNKDFLGKPDFVIAADSGLETCIVYKNFFKETVDFSPNFVLGDFDSISNKELLKSFNYCNFPCDKDFTDTELALQKAFEITKEKKCVPFITLIGGIGGRVDHFLGIYETFFSKNAPNLWLQENQALWRILPHKQYKILSLKENSVVSVSKKSGFSSFFTRKNIFTRGLEWESKCFRKKGMPSISNRISKEYLLKNKNVEIFAKKNGYILIIPLECFLVISKRNSLNL